MEAKVPCGCKKEKCQRGTLHFTNARHDSPSDIPARREEKEVGKGRSGRVRVGGKDADCGNQRRSQHESGLTVGTSTDAQILGSMWSKVIEPTPQKRERSYLREAESQLKPTVIRAAEPRTCTERSCRARL